MSKLFRLTGTYVGFEELKKELETLPCPPFVIAEAIQEKFTSVNMAAKLDTCNLHFLIQEMVKLYREAKQEGNEVMTARISTALESIGIEISDDSWGFKGESPEPIRINAKMVLL